jgi:hypothetical protein
VLGLAVATGAATVLASPRHRAFYLGGILPVSRAASGPASASPAPKGSVSRGAGSAARDQSLRVPVAERTPTQVSASGVPRGWDVKEFAGRAEVEVVRDERLAVRLQSERSSFALYRDVVVDPRERPLLSWSWKVTRLPVAADGRVRATDDAAAQIYLVFPRWPDPTTASDVIGYVWDTSAPAGLRFTSPKAANVRLIVVESGPARLGAWLEYERNVADDYVALFGREPPRVGKVALMIDSNDTRSSAEALIGDLVFSGPHRIRKETPTSMLR